MVRIQQAVATEQRITLPAAFKIGEVTRS